ncbi:Alpha/beta hydrolase domain-containing protein [Drosera capensis]
MASTYAFELPHRGADLLEILKYVFIHDFHGIHVPHRCSLLPQGYIFGHPNHEQLCKTLKAWTINGSNCSSSCSCLEWRFVMPLLEEAGLESWAVDILGWGFSDLGRPSCNVASKRNHLYQFWKSYVKRPMILIGPSLGAAVAIDFSVNHPEAVSKLVLIDASVYAEGTGNLAKLPRMVAYAGVALLKSMPLRLYVNTLALKGISFGTNLDCMNIGRLHCHFPWWEDATVDFMRSGGYNVISLIKRVSQKTLVIWGEEDKIISYKFAVYLLNEPIVNAALVLFKPVMCVIPAVRSSSATNIMIFFHLRLHCEMQNAQLRQIPDCGHIPHIERPKAVADLIAKFARTSSCRQIVL